MTSAAQAIEEAGAEETGTRKTLRILDPVLGDQKMTWDPDNDDEVALAKTAFENGRKKGLCGYRVDKKGGKAEVMKDFDPAADKMILAPPVAGG